MRAGHFVHVPLVKIGIFPKGSMALLSEYKLQIFSSRVGAACRVQKIVVSHSCWCSNRLSEP